MIEASIYYPTPTWESLRFYTNLYNTLSEPYQAVVSAKQILFFIVYGVTRNAMSRFIQTEIV